MTLYIFNCFVLLFIFYVVLIAMGTRCGSLCGWCPHPPPPRLIRWTTLKKWRNRQHLQRTAKPFDLPVPSNEVSKDIPIGDLRSEELVTSSSSTSTVSASVACSPTGETDPFPAAVRPPLCRSTNRVLAPERLKLWLHALFSFLSSTGTWTAEH